MNKIILLLVLGLVTLVSCDSTEEPKTLIKKDLTLNFQADTSVSCMEPTIAPRFGCDGKKLSSPKITGYKSRDLDISIKKDTVLSGDNLASLGYYYQGPISPSTDFNGSSVHNTGEESSDWDLGWLWSLIKLLLGILAIVLLGWLLVRVIEMLASNWKTRQMPASTTIVSSHTSSSSNPEELKKDNESKEGLSQVIEQLQKTGGKITIEIPDQNQNKNTGDNNKS